MMPEEPPDMQANTKDSVRLVIEGVVLLLLGWVGNSVLNLTTQQAVVQSQLTDIKVSLADLPKMRDDVNLSKADIARLKKDVEDIKTLRGAK